jgi:cyclophilin family peptidyl-prolyl cis-trans isomerase
VRRQEAPPELEDSLLTSCADLLREAFDSPDLRLRLEARSTALATGLLPDRLIPTEGSLRATLPATRRDPRQPAPRLPFRAGKVRLTTERGSFVIALDGRNAPNTCAMFLDLVEKGFYDGQDFHRVVPDFVAQGGDPRGDGWGGPGYTIRSEWSRLRYTRGAVGIAHDGKDTGGCQFFITLSEQPHLNGRYTIFGHVTEGMDVVDALDQGDDFRVKTMK